MTNTGPVQSLVSFKESFSTLQDPRRTSKGNIKYSLEELLFVTICGAISGFHTWDEIAEFGRIKVDWFRKFYTYKKMPSHDALNDIFAVLNPIEFKSCFLNWIHSIASKVDSDVIAIDGKTIRGAASQYGDLSLHIVTAFCASNRLTIGQEKVSAKSNEITAIPFLLDLLTIKDCTVTIDAMGTQTKIAEKIIEKEANYILQVKANQQDLNDNIEDVFNSQEARKIDVQITCGHGRIEKRTCETILANNNIESVENWKDLKTIVKIISERTIKKTGEKSVASRYYITSLNDDPQYLNKAIRSHWAIENNLHWNLDVIFKEDGQLKRKGNAAENFNIINKVALGLLDNEKSTKNFKPLKRMKASLDDAYRELIMKI